MSSTEDLVELENIGVVFTKKTLFASTEFRALRHVNLRIKPGELVILIGESGSGKTTLGRVIVGLQRPTTGTMRYGGKDISRIKGSSYQDYRKAIQLVQQDPYTSLNPSLTIERSLLPPLMKWKIAKSREEARSHAAEFLRLVGVPPEEYMHKYPHQVSGGQRQRIAIARSLSIRPDLVVLDEPVSMVDVSLRIGMLDMLLQTRQRLGTAFIFITHDLAIARYFAQKAGGARVVTLYRGSVMETGPYQQIIDMPSNPYTLVLLAAASEQMKKLDVGTFMKLSRADESVTTGCQFHPRCIYAQQICTVEEPQLREVREGQQSACHFAEDIKPQIS